MRRYNSGDRDPRDKAGDTVLGEGPTMWRRGHGFTRVGDILDNANANALPLEQSRARLVDWLRSWRITVRPELIDVLAWCESASEVRFALGFARSPGVTPFSHCFLHYGPFTLGVQLDLGPCRIDFALKHCDGRPHYAIEIDGAEWHTSPAQRCRDRERDEWLRAEGWRVMHVPSRQAAATGDRLWRLMRQEHAAAREARP